MQARIRQTCLCVVVALGSVVVLAGTALAQSSNSSLATWKLRGAMPNLPVGDSATSVILKYEAAGTGVTSTLEVMGVNGALAHQEFRGDYDGKDNPVRGNGQVGNTVGHTVALTRLDAHTVRLVHKRDGKVTLTETAVVSSDGNTMAITQTPSVAQDAQGNPVSGVAIWDRQLATTDGYSPQPRNDNRLESDEALASALRQCVSITDDALGVSRAVGVLSVTIPPGRLSALRRTSSP